jgi:hypothetical protein
MDREKVLDALRKIAAARLAALGKKVESQLTQADNLVKAEETSRQGAPDSPQNPQVESRRSASGSPKNPQPTWQGLARAILQDLAAGATTDLGCCTYYIDGEENKITVTQTECDCIPSNPPSSFDPTKPCT